MPKLAIEWYRSTQGLERLLVWMSIALLGFGYLGWIPGELGFLELVASVSFAWSVRMLGKRNPDVFGWYIGNVGVVLFIIIFLQVKLYGEVIIMLYYLVTDMIGIRNWLGGTENDPPPHSYLRPSQFAWILVLMVPGTIGLTQFLILIRGAAPLADALTTVFSMVANVMLAKNYVRSWYLWIAADAIYVPLYITRGLTITTILYVGLFFLAINGYLNARVQVRS
jgi:nicotinamide mononucleotide transporter